MISRAERYESEVHDTWPNLTTAYSTFAVVSHWFVMRNANEVLNQAGAQEVKIHLWNLRGKNRDFLNGVTWLAIVAF